MIKNTGGYFTDVQPRSRDESNNVGEPVKRYETANWRSLRETPTLSQSITLSQKTVDIETSHVLAVGHQTVAGATL